VIETILNGLLPVALAIILGWLSARIGLLKHEDAGVLATLVIRFALPFALFYAAATTPADKIVDPGLALCLTFGLMGSYLIALALGCLVFKHDLRTSTMQALVCGYPDMAYFGAPILAAMFGPRGFLCVFRGSWTRVSREGGQVFRAKLDSRSAATQGFSVFTLTDGFRSN